MRLSVRSFQDWMLREAIALFCALLVLTFALFWASPRFFQSYLVVYQFWLGVSLGSLALLFVNFLTSGKWMTALLVSLRAAARTLPVLAILSLPVLFGLKHVYPWVAGLPLEKQYLESYLNRPFFLGRTALVFGVLLILAFLTERRSSPSPRDPLPHEARAKTSAAINGAAGLIAYGILTTVLAIDWIMSLEPGWSSTVFGLIVILGQGIAALSVALLTTARPLQQDADKSLIDSGNVLLALVMTWAYLSFMQFLIVWYGNRAEETIWFYNRASGPWGWLAVCLGIFQFAAPFVLLLFRVLKRHRRALMLIAGLPLLAHLLELYWMVMPQFHRDRPHFSLWDVTLPVIVGLIWFSSFLRNRRQICSEFPLSTC